MELGSSICVRLSDGTVERLGDLAVALERSKSYLVKKAIDEYLDEYTDYLIALERLNDKDDKLVSSKQLRGQLGL